MLPFGYASSPVTASIDDAATIDDALANAQATAADPTPLARQLATTKDTLLRSMARDHLALCPEAKVFPDQLHRRSFEATCFELLVAHASARLASPPTAPPAPAMAWEQRLMGSLEAGRFAHRAAMQLTEAAVCRALAGQLLRGGDGYGDAALSARSLWREARSLGGAPEAERVCLRLPGSPSLQLRIEGDEWVSIVWPDRTEASVRVGDLALIDHAEGLRHRLSDHARERVALTAIDASPPAELQAFPAAWVCSSRVASALQARLPDHALSRWMADQALARQPEIARRIATSCVDAWRHGLVAVSADRLGRTAVLESLNARASSTVDNRSLTAARSLGDAGRIHAIVSGVLSGIGKGLSADEAVSILWREEDIQPSPAPLWDEHVFPPSPPDQHGHRYDEAFLDALAPALLDGRLSAGQATRLLDSGTPSRTLMTGSTTDVARWYGALLQRWRDGRINAGDARSLMLGLDSGGSSAWHAAFRRPFHRLNASTVLCLVRAWGTAIQAGLLPPDALRDGLLSRTPGRDLSELAHASTAHDSHWLSDVFGELIRHQHEGLLPAADLRLILDTTLDTGGLTRAVEEDPFVDFESCATFIRSAARCQLATFERLMNQCLRDRAIDGASAAGLLMARPDGSLSRSVRAAGAAGGDTDIHERMLDAAVRRGHLSLAQKSEALQAARRHALAIPPRHEPPPGGGGG